jgi:hypothetical protein
MPNQNYSTLSQWSGKRGTMSGFMPTSFEEYAQKNLSGQYSQKEVNHFKALYDQLFFNGRFKDSNSQFQEGDPAYEKLMAKKRFAEQFLRNAYADPNRANWNDSHIAKLLETFDKDFETAYSTEQSNLAAQNEASRNTMLQNNLSMQNQYDINSARDRYRDLTDPYSNYNQSIYNRLKRLSQPEGYANTQMYRMLGLGGKTSSMMAQWAQQDQETKATEQAYNAFEGGRENTERIAQGYLDQASGRTQSLMQLMSQRELGLLSNATENRRISESSRIAEQQMELQKHLEGRQENAQYKNSWINTLLGVGGSLLGGPIGGAIGGALGNYLTGNKQNTMSYENYLKKYPSPYYSNKG